MNSLLPTGKPKILIPSVVSLLLVNSWMHCCTSFCRCSGMCCMGDVPLIDVSILLFSLLSLRPSALANFLNSVQKNRQSSCGTTA